MKMLLVGLCNSQGMDGLVHMAATGEDPKKVLDLRLAHVGINGGTRESAEKITKQPATLLGLGATELAPSYFVDTCIEIMKGAGRGEKGH